MSENQANGQVACSRLQDGGKGLGKTGREKISENCVGAGERQGSEDNGIPLPGIPDDWSIVTVYVYTTTSIIGFRHAESSKHEHVEHQ